MTATSWLASCSAADETQGGVFTQSLSLEHEGRTRTYKVHLPSGRKAGEKLPVVVAFHGGGGNAERMEQISRLSQKADQSGFLIAYPEGIPHPLLGGRLRTWNAGACCAPAVKLRVDDVGFIRAMLDDIERRFGTDSTRVYATGISMGAMMSYRVACDLSDRIAAIAPIAGPQVQTSCHPQRPVSVIAFHGTRDPCSPYGGGPGGGCLMRMLGLPGKPIFDTPSIQDIVRGWASRDGAGRDAQVSHRKGAVTCRRYGPGKDGSAVELCTIEGGGHTWPGGVEVIKESLAGKTTRDISANDAMWEFFEQHPRK